MKTHIMKKEILKGTATLTDENKVEVFEQLKTISFNTITPEQTSNLVKFVRSMDEKSKDTYILSIIDNIDEIHDLISMPSIEFLKNFEDTIVMLIDELAKDKDLTEFNL
jgi:hypothetical protein